MNSLPTAQETGTPPRERLWLRNLTFVVFALFAAVAVRYQIKLLNYVEFGDESETIVAAKMIASGSELYSQIFNHHGPLVFLPGLIVEQFGSFGTLVHRIPIALLHILCLYAIYLSPLLQGKITKLIYTSVCISIILLYLPEYFGNTYTYQVIAGLFIIIILMQYTIPSLLFPEQVGVRQTILGNALIASLPFLAVTYLPACLLLFAASTRRERLGYNALFFIFFTVLNIIFLESIGSMKGFFAFHIYLNSTILPIYTENNPDKFILLRFVNNIFNATTMNSIQLIILSALIATIVQISLLVRGWPWRAILVAMSLLSLLIRGQLHVLPYMFSMLAMPSVFFWGRPVVNWQSQIIGLSFVFICFVKLSLLIPGDYEKLQAGRIPTETEFSRIVKMMTSENDRIIAYTFQNYQYIVSNRLPASGNFFYFPWQEKYNEDPLFGISINSCEDIKTNRPKLMVIDKWKVWDMYPWLSYAGCIQSLIDNEYTQISGKPFYIRNDIALERGISAEKAEVRMQPSAQISIGSPIKLMMREDGVQSGQPLKRIGVMMATYMRANPGEAELRLSAKDGSVFTQRFALATVADNQFAYFDLDEKAYDSGELVSVSGEGISTWESHGGPGDIRTCMNFEYANGQRSFTPGCPLF